MAVEQHPGPAAPDLPPTLDVVVEQRGSHQVAVVTGEIDMASVGTLRSRLHDAIVDGVPHLLVDLSAVPFMDSAGLAALVASRKQARVFQGSLALIAPSKQVSRLLTLTAMDKVFPCFDSVDDALAASTGAAG